MPLQLPADPSLGLFVYGTLKPSELGHHQVADVVSSAREAFVEGFHLKVRDGLPLLVKGSGRVEGVVLDLTDPAAGYGRVCEFEPSKQYRWGTVNATLDGGDARANVLLGRSPGTGADLEHLAFWTAADDPVFTHGLGVASTLLLGSLRDDRGRDGFFQAQAAYLLLWSAVERATALLFGPALEPMERVRKIRSLDEWDRWVSEAEVQFDDRAVVDSRDPSTQIRLARKPWEYWYQVRSNLTHRGKSAHRDLKLVRDSFIDVHDVLRVLLADLAPSVRIGWRARDPDGEEHGWRLRPVISAQAVDSPTDHVEEPR